MSVALPANHFFLKIALFVDIVLRISPQLDLTQIVIEICNIELTLLYDFFRLIWLTTICVF